MNDCDYTGLKADIRKRLGSMQIELRRLLDGLDSENHCLLTDFESFGSRFSEIEALASSFYLRCYLASFTNRYHELALAVRHLSARRHGALAVIQRGDPVDEWITPGIPIEAELTHSLLESIFFPGSPLHDGAAVIRGDRISSASSVLPLSSHGSGTGKEGTRHRAARGLSEKCDALVIVVSEESGKSSFAMGGKLYPFNSPV
ncbi:sporulation-specific diadenylate cyclase CdaS [Cohnella caldifontis]|uniref:sporulation-specific diadenylate cyclase CdaS n=1 Tax=Cohnella caldifontis TaxID=3027471 RepID=UPI0023ED5249|nr:sporulation-specific diadenylate cyclase CdaS [Cohnella sp. YIM B05605]